MKKILTTILITLLVINIIGQKNMTKSHKQELKIAQVNLTEGNYIEAFNMYSSLYKSYPLDPEVLIGVAVCKLNRRGEEKDALSLLIEAYRSGSKNDDILFYLGQAYHVHHKFDEAQNSFEEYKTNKKTNIELIEIDKNIEMAINAKKCILDPREIEIVNIGESINTPNQESVPVLLPNGKGMFFTSRRQGGFSDEKDHQGNYFQDIYYSENKNREWQAAVPAEEFNSKLHDGCVSISQDGSTLISYIITEDTLKGHSVYTGNLYYSSYIDSSWWTTPRKFGPSINSKYQELSACFSLDNKTLYFSSNRPGGYGGFDLYKVKQLPSGTWGTPVNLGPVVNTRYNEDAPFLHADGEKFYFSSEGHSTMGGFDVFETSERANKYWSTPKNVGYPINTVENDIYFTLSADNRTAYYSSDRLGSLGGQDIFKIRMLDTDNYQEVIHCNIFNKSGDTPLDARITLIDEFNHTLNGIYRSNRSGKFIMIILPEVEYQLVIEAEGYNSRIIHMNFPETGDLYTNYQFNLVKTPIKK